MTNDIKRLIESVVRERLSEAGITDIKIDEDEGFDGETVYRVMVIYDNAVGRIDAENAAGLARHTRSRLSEQNIFKFPIFRFVSKTDAKKLNAATA